VIEGKNGDYTCPSCQHKFQTEEKE